MRELEAHKTRQHAALGRTERRQPRFGQAEQGKVLRQLAVQELRSVFALGADDPQLGQRGRAVERGQGNAGQGGRVHGVGGVAWVCGEQGNSGRLSSLARVSAAPPPISSHTPDP
ncbi:hypothetical protein Y695_04119 [Hydrogenophaga sp. T4]|nr:hypothetical protein Y695_04119 [Hydrogenophaga sp. T4]